MSKKLTKKVVDGVATPEEGEVKIWDAELKGFGFRVRASGHRSWFIQYRNASGRTRRYTLGDYGTLTPEEARQEARQKLAAVAKGEDPAEDRKQKREAETVAEFATWSGTPRSERRVGKPMNGDSGSTSSQISALGPWQR
jgi:hypothetical protein